jgi:ferritin-like metal-binding protein YciE
VSGYSNPRDLLLQQLAQLLFVERMLFNEVIPSVHDESHDAELQQLLTHHRGETRTHASRVEDAMRAAGAEPAAARCAPLAAMKEEHESEAGSVKHPVLKDVFHCAGVMQTEHLELALYDAAIALARAQGLDDAAGLLEQNRGEDDAALRQVEKLADRLRGELPKP